MSRLSFPFAVGISVLLAGTALDYLGVLGYWKVGSLCLVPFAVHIAMKLLQRSRSESSSSGR